MNKITLALVFLLISSASAGDSYQIDKINITSDQNSANIMIQGLGILNYTTYTLNSPRRLVIELAEARLPDTPLSYRLHPPLKRLNIQPVYNDTQKVKIIIEYEAESEYELSAANGDLEIKFLKPKTVEKASGSDTDKPLWLQKKINLTINEGSVATALNLISKQAQFDIVIAEILETPLWLNLENVTVEDALKAIVSSTGNTYYIAGKVAIATKRSDETDRDLITNVYKLKYINASILAENIKESLSPSAKIKVLSDNNAGDNNAKKPSNFLLLTDYRKNHIMVQKIIDELDVIPQQIAISVKFVESNISAEKNLGIDWNKTAEVKLSGADPSNSQNLYNPNSALSAFSPWAPDKNSFVYGTLTFSEATAILRYLSESGKSRLLSDPSVTASDGKQASISVTTTIPIQTINRFSEGAVIQDIVTYEYKEVGITLDVTPRVNEEGRITLYCVPSVEEITGWVGPENNQQPITTKRSVETEVVVVNGETLVIGGLYKESNIENESKIWLLGDIPILGSLFKIKQLTKNNTDLLIFITPKILE